MNPFGQLTWWFVQRAVAVRWPTGLSLKRAMRENWWQDCRFRDLLCRTVDSHCIVVILYYRLCVRVCNLQSIQLGFSCNQKQARCRLSSMSHCYLLHFVEAFNCFAGSDSVLLNAVTALHSLHYSLTVKRFNSNKIQSKFLGSSTNNCLNWLQSTELLTQTIVNHNFK